MNRDAIAVLTDGIFSKALDSRVGQELAPVTEEQSGRTKVLPNIHWQEASSCPTN